jgi:hypothetical protein
MNLIKSLFVCSMMINTAYAAEKQMDTEQVKNKFSVVEGKYKLAPNSDKNCVSGELEVFKGKKGILSLKMGEGLLAKHLDVAYYKDFEKKCTLVIKNTKIKNGFNNEEIMNCVNPKSSYSRTIKAEFKKNKFSYELRFKRVKNAGKILTACYLIKTK